jgi:[acyl-carrier-protein] S-malonyltransferase
LMIWAVDGLREAVEGVTFADPSAPLLTNLDASLITTGAQARHELLMHLITGVDWVLAVQTMAAAGVERFIEIGPGRVLTGLIKRIVPDLEALATDAPNATDGLAVPDLETLPQR